MMDRVQNYLDIHSNEALTLLEKLAASPSVAAQNIGMAETANLVEAFLKEDGFQTRQLLVDGAPPYVYGEQRGASSFILLLYNHYDVQPAEPLELWKSEPYQPVVRDGNLYARGVSDNKGEIASRLEAIRALRAATGGLPITIRWIIEGEEEVGSPHFGTMAARYAELLKADACLWEGEGFDHEDRPGVALGTKGLLYVQYDVKKIGRDAHSGNASFLPNAAWRLVKALDSLKDETGKVLIPGFYDAVLPPTETQKEALRDLPDETDILRRSYDVDQFIDNLTGYALRERSAFSPTGNIAGFSSGYSGEGIKTVLPAKAMAKMDFRLVPNQDPDRIFNALQDHLDAQGFNDIQLTKLGSAAPVVTPIEHPFVQRIISISEAFAGKPASITPIMGGTLPLLEPLQKFVGVPGLSAPGNAGYWDSGAHAPNEHIRLSDLERAVRFNIHMFQELAK
jgi:acetylornithine deacetylase/succinyl-diaminopimelate desuccinylase-like protein